jgi:hypothetical protein
MEIIVFINNLDVFPEFIVEFLGEEKKISNEIIALGEIKCKKELLSKEIFQVYKFVFVGPEEYLHDLRNSENFL